MRHLLLLAAALLLMVPQVRATGTPDKTCTGDRTITTQAQFDAFVAEGCTSLTGSLGISGNTTLTSLAGLETLTHIGGAVSISGNMALTSLDGLNGLTSIGGSLSISGNAVLASLSGLESLTSTGGAVYVAANPVLVDCACGLSGLASETSLGSYTFVGVGGPIYFAMNGGASCNSEKAVLDEIPACTAGIDCADPATAPSYAGGYVLNSAGTRAFIKVEVPAGGTFFEFYNTRNLIVDGPYADPDAPTGLSAWGMADGMKYSFTGAPSPTTVYFAIRPASSSSNSVAFFLKVTDTCKRVVDVDPEFALSATSETLEGFALSAQPNLFSGQTTLRFSMEEAGQARLSVYDVLGREVAVVASGDFAAGKQSVRFDASGLSSGLYLVRLEADGRALTQTITVAR